MRGVIFQRLNTWFDTFALNSLDIYTSSHVFNHTEADT